MKSFGYWLQMSQTQIHSVSAWDSKKGLTDNIEKEGKNNVLNFELKITVFKK